MSNCSRSHIIFNLHYSLIMSLDTVSHGVYVRLLCGVCVSESTLVFPPSSLLYISGSSYMHTGVCVCTRLSKLDYSNCGEQCLSTLMLCGQGLYHFSPQQGAGETGSVEGSIPLCPVPQFPASLWHGALQYRAQQAWGTAGQLRKLMLPETSYGQVLYTEVIFQ